MLVHTHRQPILLKQGEEDLAFEPAPHPLPSDLPPAVHVVGHPASAADGLFLTLGSLGDYHSTSGTESTEGRFREVGLPPLPLHPRSDDLAGVVREAMQPTHVSMWLRPDTTYEGEQAE